jgi:hypothetical protein
MTLAHHSHSHSHSQSHSWSRGRVVGPDRGRYARLTEARIGRRASRERVSHVA